MRKFINLTNHPSSNWSQSQLLAAQQLGEVIDIPFPIISDTLSKNGIEKLVKQYVNEIETLSDNQPCIVHIMGEMTFSFSLVNKLKEKDYTCVASTTKRIVEELPNGMKNVKFEFCQFREY